MKHVKTILNKFFIKMLFVGIFLDAHTASFFDSHITTKLLTPQESIDENIEKLDHLKEELNKNFGSKIAQKKNELIQSNLNSLDAKITQIKAELKDSLGNVHDFLTKKLSLLNDQYQTLFNIQSSYSELSGILEKHIKVLQDYQQDPALKSLSLVPHAMYSYDDVINALKKVFVQEEVLEGLNIQLKDELLELQNREKAVEIKRKDYKEKSKKQEVFAKNIETSLNLNNELTPRQRGELIDLEEQLAAYQKQLAELRVQVTQNKLALIKTTLNLEGNKLNILKENVKRIKSGLRITQGELLESKNKLEEVQQANVQKKEELFAEIKRLTVSKEPIKVALEELRKQYKISKDDYTLWNVSSAQPDQYMAACETGDKLTQLQLLEAKIDYLRAQVQAEDIKYKRKEVRSMVLGMWYNLTHRMKGSDEFAQEVKKFKDVEIEINREINLFQDKRHAVLNSIDLQKKALSSIRNLIQGMQRDRDRISKRLSFTYATCLTKLQEAEKAVLEQIELYNKIGEIYAHAVSTMNAILKEDSTVIEELETKNIWQRSKYAISWQGIKNIIPDLHIFYEDFLQLGSTYLASFSWSSVQRFLYSFFSSPAALSLSFLFMLLSCLLLWLLKVKSLSLIRYLTTARRINWTMQTSLRIAGCLLSFVRMYGVWLYVWCVCFFLVHYNFIQVLFPSVLFYLLSIPLLIFFVSRLIDHMIECNREQNFAIFHELFEKRFAFVCSLLAYISIFIWMFKEAFLLATVHKSELPNILIAIYSIILRVLIIFSIGKDEILVLLEHKSGFWHWAESIIEKFYYVLLVAIIFLMILSDPYVGGYGNLIYYLLWGSLGTLLLIKILQALYHTTKKYSSIIFFSQDEEVVRERFVYAQTCYGIFVISLLVIFIGVAFFVGLKIWDIPVSLNDTWKLIDLKLFSTGFEKGEVLWFTPRKFVLLIAIIMGGLFGAVAFNRLILQKIFDVLPVELGIQNTILSITRYLIVVIAIYFGFQWAGLSNLLIAISIVIGSISYILKEPVGDFISYFIILVQRPIQIGDYIQINEEVQGVVRKITPRSVILRKRDSYSIILPNSTILTHPISNWSYARNFIAFDDIHFTIAYGVDPIKVRKILSKVLEESTDILKAPRPIIRLENFSDNGYIFMVRGFISNINILKRWDIASDVRFAIVKALAEEQIRLAIPTRIILAEQSKT